MTLARYKQKRNLQQTPEPKGKIGKSKEQIFVVQKHAASHLHYDLRLALHGVLKSWAVPKGPCLDPRVKRLAVEVEDHPLDYAKFEGTIPQGHYGAGEVIVWDYGHWTSKENLYSAYKKGNMKFTLEGKKLKGDWKLIKLKTPGKPQWLLIKGKDKYAKELDEIDILETKPKSVFSSKIIPPKKTKELKKNSSKSYVVNASNSPTFKPELATLTETMPEGDEWIYEHKFDGYRIIAFVNKAQVKLLTRNNLDWTHRFPQLADELKKLNLRSTLLDGEVVVLEKKNKSSFQALQNLLNTEDAVKNLHYYLFDMPAHENKDLADLPLIERKKQLKNILKPRTPHIHYTEHEEGNAEKLLQTACKKGWEGLIAKNKNSLYQQTRTRDWLKLKCQQRQEFIVIGYTEPGGSRHYFGSLLLAQHDKNQKLIYAGHVGTGFNQQSLKNLYEKLKPLKQSTMPLAKKPADPLARKVHWVKPKLIVEVQFTEWTDEGILRHPSYQGLRMDKSTREVFKEMPSQAKASMPELTHPDKILYPKAKITKLELANYLEKVSEHILPYLINKPISVLRCPEGPNKQCFFQKHWTAGMPKGLLPIVIKDKEKPNEYITLKNTDGLIGLAQLAVLEIHPWASTNNKLNYPDQLIFDLDPDDKVSWKTLVEATLIVRETLDNLEIKSFVKLTGGKGIHVVAPLKQIQQFSTIKPFAKLLADQLSKNFPKLFTSNMNKIHRKNKIFLDYLRNDREATAIAAFSPRRNENANIAVPISWKALPEMGRSSAYSIESIDEYFKDFPKNPWADFFKSKQNITEAQRKALAKLAE